jgi:hypothetical protein
MEIVRYTQPGPAFNGATVTEVTYTAQLYDVADWAKDFGVIKEFHNDSQLSAYKTPRESEMELVLSSDGWHALR